MHPTSQPNSGNYGNPRISNHPITDNESECLPHEALDLREVQVQRLELNSGASKVLVRLPTHGAVSATMSTGATSLAVEVPPEVAAHIRVDGGLSRVMIDEQRFPRVRSEGLPGLAFQREYRSLDFDSAANRVDLRISAGAAGIQVR